MNSETITKSDQRDIISKLPPHTLLWLEARMQLVRNDGISRRSSTHDNQKHLNDRSENTSVSSQSPQDNRRWKETGKPTATEDEYEAPKRLRNMEGQVFMISISRLISSELNFCANALHFARVIYLQSDQKETTNRWL